MWCFNGLCSNEKFEKRKRTRTSIYVTLQSPPVPDASSKTQRYVVRYVRGGEESVPTTTVQKDNFLLMLFDIEST